MTTTPEKPPIIIQRKSFLFHHPPEEASIGQHYKIGKQLSRGGFGVIHRYTHHRTKQRRAVKILPKALVSNEAFHREIKVLQTIDHPNVLRLYESFEDDDNYYVVMEMATGGDLHEYLVANVQNMGERDVAALMRQLLICIHHCHAHGVVHCDIKPENILLEKDNQHAYENLTVCDFGFAQFYGEERFHKCHGTPEFLAPEVYRRNYGPKCDLWSCGILAYLLLIRDFPFPGETPRDICKQLRDREDHFDVEGWNRVSEIGKDFVQALLAKDENLRPTAEVALQHPWLELTRQHSNVQISRGNWNDNLIQFSAEQKLKQATYAFIVAQLTFKKHKKIIDEVFRSVDTNGDGRICQRELTESFRRKDKVICQGELEDIFRRVDIDQNGYINYWEFIAATRNSSVMLCADNLKAAFGVFDKSNSNSITAQDLKCLFLRDKKKGAITDDIDDNVIDAIIGQVDLNSDGEISYEEFVSMMQEKTMPSKRPYDSTD